MTFAPSGAQTLVTLVHSGWEALDDPAAAREEYEQGWPTVLQAYADLVAESAHDGGDEGDTWVALMHTAAADVSGSVFADESVTGGLFTVRVRRWRVVLHR